MLFRFVRQAAAISALFVLTSLSAAVAEPADPANQITIRLVKLPSNTPPNAAIYLSGDFNGWSPLDERYRLTPDAQGQYGIILPASVHDLSKFKLTLGEQPGPAETDAQTDAKWQYLISGSESGTIYLAVQSWRDRSVQVLRGVSPLGAARNTFQGAGLFESNVVPFLALGLMIVIPVAIYIRYRRRKDQILLLSAIEGISPSEYSAKGKDLSEAIAALRSNSKELERWSRVVER